MTNSRSVTQPQVLPVHVTTISSRSLSMLPRTIAEVLPSLKCYHHRPFAGPPVPSQNKKQNLVDMYES